MSIRIQNDAVSSGVSPEVNRTGDAGHAGGSSGKGRVGTTTAGGDQVEISNTAQTFSQGVSAASAQHSARVRELTALYASGRYQVDSHQVSRALVNSSISAGAPAGKA